MKIKKKLLNFLSELEFQHTIEDHERALLETYSWIKTGIREQYPLIYDQFVKWNKIDNYIIIKANEILEREAELWGKGYRGRTHIELANEELIQQLQDELAPLEKFFDETLFSTEELSISFFVDPDKENRLFPEYRPITEMDIIFDTTTYLLPNDDENLDDYDLDKNPMIESKN